MLQELLTHELLEAPAIPSGTALMSALSLLLGALFPLLVSPLFTPPFTLAGKRVQEHSTICEGCMVSTLVNSLPQEREIFPWHMGLWYGEHQIRWAVKRGDFKWVFLVPPRSVYLTPLIASPPFPRPTLQHTFWRPG